MTSARYATSPKCSLRCTLTRASTQRKRLLIICALRRGELQQATAYNLAGNFLFRVPSELLPLEYERTKVINHQGKLARQVTLPKRKNKPHGSTLIRPGDKIMCPVHALEDLSHAERRSKGRIFFFSVFGFTRTLRTHVAAIPEAEGAPEEYSSQGFRRGTAREMLAAGGTLAKILEAGEWNSKAFREYQDSEEIDAAAILEIIVEDDEAEDELEGAAQVQAPAAAPQTAPKRAAKRGAESRKITEFFGQVELAAQ